MSVKILWKEKTIPHRVQIGFLGRFETKSWTPEPSQCFKCQKFWHIAKACTALHAKCRICRETHLSDICQKKKHQNRSNGEVCQLRGQSPGVKQAMQEMESNRANSHRENTRTAKTRCKKTNCADSHRLSQHCQGQGKYKQ